MKPSTKQRRLRQVAWALAFGLATWLTIVLFLRIFAPPEFEPAKPFSRDYDRSAMTSALDAAAIRTTLDEIEALGSRAPGQPGYEATYQLIRQRFVDAGLELYEQEIDTVYPHATQTEISLEGTPLAIDLWPAPPNFVQPMVTPPEGLSGELMLISEESVRECDNFDGKIAVVDMAHPLFRELGLAPGRYNELGFRAMIVTHSGGLDAIQWSRIEALRQNLPLNYVRLVAAPELLEHIGSTVRLDIQTAYQKSATTNLVAVMRAPRPQSAGAVVISASYDSFTYLPDLAYGSLQALQVAIQLNLLEGILPHRERLERDVIFVATSGDYTAQNSLTSLLAAIGPYDNRNIVGDRINLDRQEHEERLATLERLQQLFANPAFAVDSAASTEALRELLPADREFFTEQFRYIMRRRVFYAAEPLLQARIRFERNPNDLNGEPYHAFRKAKLHYDALNSLAALPLPRFIDRYDPAEIDLRATLTTRLIELQNYHQTALQRIEQESAIFKLFRNYSEFLVIAPTLMPGNAPNSSGREVISFTGGLNIVHSEAADVFRRMLQDAAYALGLTQQVTVDFRGMRHGTAINATMSGMPIHAQLWSQLSFPAFSVISPEGDYASFATPLPHPAMTNLQTIAGSLLVMGEATLSATLGYGRFPRLSRCQYYNLTGTVFASGIGNSVVPNYPMADTMICIKEDESRYNRIAAGFQRRPLFYTNPYGEYRQPFLTVNMFFGWADPTPLSAVWFGDDGLIAYYKDEGLNAQNMYKSRTMSFDGSPVNLILYRGTAVAILNRVNPQSMRAFVDAEFIRTQGLTPFSSTAKFVMGEGILNFVPPEERFFVTLKAGSPENEQVSVTRAFCLGVRDPAFEPDPEEEIDGLGYLAQDTPVLRNVAAEAAASMEFLASKRLVLQRHYGMVDEMTATFHERAAEAFDKAEMEKRPLLARLRDYRQAVSYQIINHPVIRNSIAEAVWGILWYMGLLVPFIFFFEKLVFGFTDIRKQLTAQTIIFLVVFALLRILHPAFQMIRSSMMILLGFVIILISGGITLVLSSKFRENIDALRSAQGAIKGAEVNKMGVMLTAFMLGLNNMHKRKVRTGLTCATLVLMTFVMISFTSVQSNVVDKVSTVGPAAYQGLLVREPLFMPISASEVAALDSRYGELFSVNERVTVVGTYNHTLGRGVTPEISVVHGEGTRAANQIARSALLLRHTEPLRNSIKLLATNGWFTAAQADGVPGVPPPAMLPDTMAEALGITIDAVNAGNAAVRINGRPFLVHNIFVADSLEATADLDGDNLLPYDAEALVNPQQSAGSLLADRDAVRVPASLTLITLSDALAAPAGGALRTLSVAVDMEQAIFATAKQEIVSYLEQTGRETSYGLDGTAYLGRRAREQTLGGLIDLLIPLIIAALTVLNTMKGSVYERRSEIFVYNAVGIAPRYIFFMFVAEALVYAVVGSLLGYILSQGTGRILTALDWTGGMNMNFTSISTIYASLAIAVATILSTWFPARSAMEIAKPAEKSGWTLPTTEDDELAFELPFTFTHHDRIAVLGFFYQYFANLGEGSAGPFFAGVPRLEVHEREGGPDGTEYVPAIVTQVWLKPFDLGVSQRISIDLATDPATGEYISLMRLQRITGTREAWLRLNTPLVALIRRHFLHWRAVTDDRKEVLYAEARRMLEAGMESRS